jgi:paraquat-inducible protein B
MSEPPHTRPPSAPAPAQPELAVRARRLPSMIWVVPIVAALIGLWLVAYDWIGQGPIITIEFATAEGIELGKTKIRYKEVDIGDVKSIVLTDDRKGVLVSAQLIKSARDLLASDSRFFVVRPRITGGTVSGLGTLLSGAYIGIDPGTSKETSKNFVGLDQPPIVTGDVPGREFKLHGDEIGSLDYGAPIYFRHVNVGHVTHYALDRKGEGVDIDIFIDTPYDRFVTANSRFWHASGVDVSLDANGLKLTTESLVAMVEGGIAFQDLPDQPAAAAPAAGGTQFTLYASRELALRLPELHGENFVMYFPESLRGLSVGAPVDFHGIVIGEVRAVDVEYEGSGRIRFPVQVEVYPDRLRSRVHDGSAPRGWSPAANRQIVDRLVQNGMRGELRTGNLVTGQLYVALDFHPDVDHAAVDWSHTPPIVPTIAGGLTRIQETIGRVADKLDRVPVEHLAAQLSQALSSLDTTMQTSRDLIARLDSEVAPQATRTLKQAETALQSANAVLLQDAPLQRDLQQALQQVAQSARALAVLADYLERHPEALLRGKPGDAK